MNAFTISFAHHPCAGWVRIFEFHGFYLPEIYVQRIVAGEA